MPTRFRDVFRGAEVNADTDCSDNTTPPGLPLNVCDKRELLQVLNTTVNVLQLDSPRLACAQETPSLQWRMDGASSPELFIDERPQRAHFTWDARPLREWRAGAYALDFDPDGRLRQRQFVPADLSPDDPRWSVLETTSAHRLWLWWPTDRELDAAHPFRRQWLSRWPDAPKQGPWLAIEQSGDTHALDQQWSLSPAQCRLLLGG